MADTQGSGPAKTAILVGLVAAVVAYMYLREARPVRQKSDKVAAARDTTPQESPPPKAAEQYIDLNDIKLSDLEMRPSGTRVLTGDVRPYYLVSGRVENYTGRTLSSVTIHIFVQSRGSPYAKDPNYKKDWQIFDQTDMQIDGPIPELTSGFSRDVQLLPPKKQNWTWEADVVAAKAE